MLNTTSMAGLPERSSVDGWVFMQGVRTLTATTNKSYLSWEGLDASGAVVKGTLFEDKVAGGILPNMNQGDVWAICGVVGNGRNGLMIWANTMALVTDQVDIEAFKNICIPTHPKADVERYINELQEYAKSIQNPELNKLSAALWTYFKPFLYTMPAGKANHEPFRGGLAKHTHELVKALDIPYIWEQGLNRDVLIFSAIFHDLGKVKTYTDTMSMTHEGKLIPHSFIALELIAEAVALRGIVIDSKLLTHVRHCIASHHGAFSEQKPLTREANALHQADMLVSRLGHFTELMKGAVDNCGWGQYSTWLTGSPYIPEMDNNL